MSNKFSRIINKINKCPAFCRSWLLTKAFCSKVKFAGTTGIKIEEITDKKVTILLDNSKKVQNHIGGIHAIAAAVIAESATGIVFGMNVPDEALPLLKSMNVEYKRRMQGSLKAVASLDDNLITQIKSEERGDVLVTVVITDESGEQPILCHMNWAWVPKRS